jgi:hypothetical protein
MWSLLSVRFPENHHPYLLLPLRIDGALGISSMFVITFSGTPSAKNHHSHPRLAFVLWCCMRYILHVCDHIYWYAFQKITIRTSALPLRFGAA